MPEVEKPERKVSMSEDNTSLCFICCPYSLLDSIQRESVMDSSDIVYISGLLSGQQELDSSQLIV